MIKLVLLTALFSQILFAQQNNLALDIQPVSESGVNWETTLTLDAQSGMENGLLVELPTGIKMVPLTARINADEMLLQNTSEIPSKDNVVSWELSEDGIILYFQDGQLSSGDQLVLKTMTSQIKKRIEDNQQINIRTIVSTNPDVQFSEDIKSSGNIVLNIEN